jgi:hypothetical protein
VGIGLHHVHFWWAIVGDQLEDRLSRT